MAIDKKFIQKAIKRPGALTRKAKSAGKSILSFAQEAVKAGSKASTLTKQQAGFYLRVLRPAVKKRKS
ncbi:hypothetical protein LCGC14_0432970 [marine sediment metagenome]|uniref:Uncharacterized protein n=1 Tax=marine sediment metagenome TaxID=412755 RepID=A0A0F9T5Z4_9ZZZZ